MKKKKVIIISVIVIIAAAIGITMCSKSKGKKTSVKAKSETYTVKTGEIKIKLEETGEIQPITQINLKSKVSGKIIRFYVKENDYIKKGDLIADIEPDYNQASTISNVKNSLKLNEIRLKNAREDLANKTKLFKENYISKNVYDQAKDELDKAVMDNKLALQQYELIKEIDTEGNVTKLLATASGTVIQKLIEEGEMVVASTGAYSEGTVVLKLADLSKMIVKATINEVDISKVKIGQLVQISVDAYPYVSYTGKITKIAAMASISNNVKVFPIEIQIDQTDSKLKPGMTANITIQGETRSNIVTIPIRALFSDENGNDIVYKVVKDTVTVSTQVKTGINNFQDVEIIEGLKVGDKISLTETKTTTKLPFEMH